LLYFYFLRDGLPGALSPALKYRSIFLQSLRDVERRGRVIRDGIMVRRVAVLTPGHKIKDTQPKKPGLKTMQNCPPFREVLEAAASLSFEEQETLLEIMHRRLIDIRRDGIAKDVLESLKEFEQGQLMSAASGQIMEKILS